MDIQEMIFRTIKNDIEIAELRAAMSGILSGIEDALKATDELGLKVLFNLQEGDRFNEGDLILRVQGSPIQMIKAEEKLIGMIAKTSGIATAARRFADAAGEEFSIVCGSWKKIEPEIRGSYRRAVATGGCRIRLLDEPMIYLDKNYVIMFGSIQETLERIGEITEFADRKKVIQVKNYDDDLAREFWEAAEFGADVIYLDTGNVEDMEALEEARPYMHRIPKIAFGGDVRFEDIERIKDYPVDIVGVGRAIIDAPMVDMKFDVITRKLHICEHKAELKER